jgi:hypothetical protein
VRTRWLVRFLLAGAVGWTLPATAPAQTNAPAPLPPTATNFVAQGQAVVIHQDVIIPPAEQVILPADGFTAPTPSSGGFHILPQSWREAIARRFGRSSSAPMANGFVELPAEVTGEPPRTQVAEPSVVIPTSSPVPLGQALPLGQPSTLGPAPGPLPPIPPPIRPTPIDTWSSPPEPPITGETPLPYIDPSMAWRKMPVSAPSDLPPLPAPSYPRHSYLLPECIRAPLGRCLNGCGLGCYADRDTPGCGGCRQAFLFVFGSCRYFFGETCFPDY